MNKSIDTKARSIRLNAHLTRKWPLGVWVLCLGLLLQREACALTLTVVDGAGAPVTHFRWRLEEDNTATGVPGHPTYKTVSRTTRTSNTQVIATGSGAAVTIPSAAGKRYLLSVIADGYFVGVAKVRPTDLALRVILKKAPSPRQKYVMAFHDKKPVHNCLT
jgi:hypothetical protein